MAKFKIRDVYFDYYKEDLIAEAQDFLDRLGISYGKYTLNQVDLGVIWYCEKEKEAKGSAVTKKQLDEINSAKAKGGLKEVKKTDAYKDILKQIETTGENLGIDPKTGNKKRQPKPPRQSRQSRQARESGQPRQGRRDKGETNPNSPEIKPPDPPKSSDKFITTKLTDTLVYGKPKPKYNAIELLFKNDFDRVSYILRNKKTRSKEHARYFEWARTVSGGQPDHVIRQHGEKVLAVIKGVVGNRRSGDAVIPPVPLDFDPPDPRSINTNPTTPPARSDNGGISPGSLLGRQSQESTTPVNGDNLMNRSARLSRGGSFAQIVEILEKIQKSVDSILAILQKQSNFQKKIYEQDRKRIIQDERKRREAASEQFIKGLVESALATMKPIQGMIERIINFIVNTVIGRVINDLLKWAADPRNKDKVRAISRFFKDWWPILLGTYVLFFTNFGKFVRYSVIGVARLAMTIGKQIPKLLALIKKLGPLGKVAAISAVVGTTVVGANQLMKDDTKEDKPPQPTLPKTPAFNFGGLVSLMNPRKSKTKNIGFTEGGSITSKTGLTVTGAAEDTRLIAASPGEYVLSKPAVVKTRRLYGEGFLEGLNKMAGSTGVPKMVDNIQLAQQGGMVGRKGSGTSMSKADYEALLAISAAEDSDPQGRADVAQAIYNRAHASGNGYNMNFMPTDGIPSIKNLITGEGQFEPTKKNPQDWKNIKDRKSGVRALANYLAIMKKSGSPDLKQAEKMIKETEKALRDVGLQENAQKHVLGRTAFYGVSQHKNMKGDDVLRTEMVDGKPVRKKDNFFSHHLSDALAKKGDQGAAKWSRDGRRMAAPIPGMMQPPPKPKPQPDTRNIFQKTFDAIFRPTPQAPIRTSPVRVPGRRPTANQRVSFNPPIDLRQNKSSIPTREVSIAAPSVPSFSLYPPDFISDRKHMKEAFDIVAA